MASRESADAGNALHSLKDVLRVLRERDIHVVKSTLWLWRSKLPPCHRPPIKTTMTKTGRLVLISTRTGILQWVEKMERRKPESLFALPRKHHATRAARLERLAKAKARAL